MPMADIPEMMGRAASNALVDDDVQVQVQVEVRARARMLRMRAMLSVTWRSWRDRSAGWSGDRVLRSSL
jgi:hypothetical protein